MSLDSHFQCYKFAKLTVTTSATPIVAADLVTAADPTPSSNLPAQPGTPCKRVEISVDSHPIRFTFDGTTAPVASTTGIPVQAGGSFALEGSRDIANFQAISDDGSNATLQIHFLR